MTLLGLLISLGCDVHPTTVIAKTTMDKNKNFFIVSNCLMLNFDAKLKVLSDTTKYFFSKNRIKP